MSDEQSRPENTDAATTPRTNEFKGRTLLVVSAAIGLAASMNAMMIYSLGAFIGPLESEFGWPRGDISLAVTVLTMGLFLAGPVVGTACDRFGAAAVGSASLAAFGLLLLAMAATLESLVGLWTFFFLIALAGAGSTPIVLARPISAAFVRQRGLALGVVLTGAGLGGFWLPNFVTEVVSRSGWRGAYTCLALIALFAAPVVYLGFKPAERREAMAMAKGNAAAAPGLTLREARTTAAFWAMSALGVSMAMGIGGMMVHLVPLFRDLGATPADAAATASMMGIASVVGRLAVGMCLDRFTPHRVAVSVLALGMLGVLLLRLGGLDYAVAGVMLIGLLLGAELDMLAFLTARLFGQRAFGAIYGWCYSIYALGFGVSPFLIGRLRDASGSYDSAMTISMAVLVVAIFSAVLLGRRTPLDSSTFAQTR
jgi:MFS family permease